MFAGAKHLFCAFVALIARASGQCVSVSDVAWYPCWLTGYDCAQAFVGFTIRQQTDVSAVVGAYVFFYWYTARIDRR